MNIQNKVESSHSYVNISKVYMSKGLYDRTQEILENYLKNISDNYLIHSLLALNYFGQGKYDFALGEVEKAFLLKPTELRFAWLRGAFTNLKGWEARFHELLAYLYLKSRDPETGLEEYNKVWRIAVEEDILNYQRSALYGKGLAYLEIKSLDKAQIVADELKD